MKIFLKRFINWTIFLSVIGGLIVLFLSLDPEFRIMIAILIGLVIIVILVERLPDFLNKLSNKNEPILSIDARVVSKSIKKISKDTDYYYLTFEINSRERFTLRVTIITMFYLLKATLVNLLVKVADSFLLKE